MTEFFAKMVDAFVKALPPALTRVLLVITVVGAAILHGLATNRISSLERSQDALKIQVKTQTDAIIASVESLAGEVRMYRENQVEENKLLRQAVRNGQKR